MKAYMKSDYEELAEAYRKGLPKTTVVKILERQREINNEREIHFWNELSEEEAEELREYTESKIIEKKTDNRGRLNLGNDHALEEVKVLLLQ